MKKLLLVLIICLIPAIAWSADVTLRWDVVTDATGYKIYKSEDLGVTWGTARDVGNVITYIYTGIIETKVVLFRVSAYNANGESVRLWSGAWYDNRLKPISTPSGAGIQ